MSTKHRSAADIGMWCALWVLKSLALFSSHTRSFVAALVFRLAWIFGGTRKSIATTNLKMCFPDFSDQKIKTIVRGHFKAYARAFIDRFFLWSASPEAIRQFVSISGWEHFTPHDGKPVIVFAPHFLGMEAGGIRFQLERRVVNIYSRQASAELDRWILEGRHRFNDPVLLPKHEGLMPAIRWLKKGLPFHFSPDMDLGQRDSVFAVFFGVQAATVTSMVRIARVTGAPIVPLVTRMTADGYKSQFYPGWSHPNDDSIQTLEEGVRVMNAFIEKRILEAPEQYLWTHRRFKTRPPGASPVYA